MVRERTKDSLQGIAGNFRDITVSMKEMVKPKAGEAQDTRSNYEKAKQLLNPNNGDKWYVRILKKQEQD